MPHFSFHCAKQSLVSHWCSTLYFWVQQCPQMPDLRSCEHISAGSVSPRENRLPSRYQNFPEKDSSEIWTSCSSWKGNSLNQMGQRQATQHSPVSWGRAVCQRKGTVTWASGVLSTIGTFLSTTGMSLPKSHLSSGLYSVSAPPHLTSAR